MDGGLDEMTGEPVQTRSHFLQGSGIAPDGLRDLQEQHNPIGLKYFTGSLSGEVRRYCTQCNHHRARQYW